MALKTTFARAAQALDLILSGVNVNPAAGSLCFYSGLPATSLADPPNGVLLAECVLVDGTVNAFAPTTTTPPLTAVGYTADDIFAIEESILASGEAQSFRLLNYMGNPVLQGSAGEEDADFLMDDASLLMGNRLVVEFFNVTTPVGV